MVMATKSILKNVTIKDNKTAGKLATALEQSGQSNADKQQARPHYTYANSEDIRKMFAGNDK